MNKELRIKNYGLRINVFIVAFSVLYFLFFVSLAFAAHTNIDETDKWAWNDARGWINFHSAETTVEVTDAKIEGYAVFNDVAGDYVSFDCATSPDGNICGSSNYSVFNDGLGNLTGWAWNDGIGWISFCGGSGTTNCPGTASNYQVTVDPDSGDFSGWAWNDIIGWISFNCADPGVCGASSYKVKTGFIPLPAADGSLTSNTFDTGVEKGAGYNSITWVGDLGPAGNTVRFQFATSDCENGALDPNNEDGAGVECDDSPGWGDPKTSGDGAFVGDDGTVNTDYTPLGSDKPEPLGNHHNNKRYYRYKILLNKAQGNEISPVVEDVIINWSR